MADGAIVPHLNDEKGPTMKLTTIALATAFALSTIALAQAGTDGQSGTSVGSVVAPSVGSYYWPSVGSTLAVPTWSNTNPPAPGAAAVGSAPLASGIRR
jgi:hypothetical protein